ncbi:hypothetical protein [Segatella oris]|uniref:hypothetical protein n=1 Tax=Segatella oris TaxID=28135 RepID=UPI0024203DAB|nr:hypothetical protein [Segatella oris]
MIFLKNNQMQLGGVFPDEGRLFMWQSSGNGSVRMVQAAFQCSMKYNQINICFLVEAL